MTVPNHEGLMSNITIKDVEYVAGLAQLQLDDAAKERLVREMGDTIGMRHTWYW